MADRSMDMNSRNGLTSQEEFGDDDIIAKDLPEYISLLTQIKEKAIDMCSGIEMFGKKLNAEEIQTEKGISFIDVKFHLLLEYLTNLVFTMLLKVDGKPIEGENCIERLIEIRTVLEKIRPIDQKLKYQIDKLIKVATTGVTSQHSSTHPLSFRPNPENLVSKTDTHSEDDNQDDDNDNIKKSSIYVPRKVSSVPYEEGTHESRKRKLEERVKQHTLNSSLLKDLREEYSEAPEEFKEDHRKLKASKVKDAELEKERYEEENLMRLPMTKQDKKLQRSVGFDKITQLDSMGILDLEGSDNEETYRNSYSKGKKSNKFKKGKKKSNSKKKWKKS